MVRVWLMGLVTLCRGSPVLRRVEADGVQLASRELLASTGRGPVRRREAAELSRHRPRPTDPAPARHLADTQRNTASETDHYIAGRDVSCARLDTWDLPEGEGEQRPVGTLV